MEKRCVVCNSIKVKEKNNLFLCKNCSFYEKKIKSLFSEVRIHYDIYSEYQKIVDNAKRSIYYKIKKFLIKKFNDKKLRVLEIGFGTGYLLKCLETMNYDLYGIEASKKLSDIAQKFLKKVTIYCNNFQNIVLPLNFFDVVIMIDVLDEVEDVEFFVKKLNRILKKNGIVIIRIRNAIVHLLLDKLSKFLSLFIEVPFVYHNFGFTFKSLKMLLIKNGFSILQNRAYLYLTSGDPYKQSKISKEITSFLKNLCYVVSEIVYIFTKIVLSPSFMVYAIKK
ncbi:MAG: class I SAM-dependent methyltransferase [Endomicrobia bacterium]|nr:class I SAM-dependent methyltransferase [Endomicrobiia bacterium]